MFETFLQNLPGIGLIGLICWQIYEKKNSGSGNLRQEIDSNYKILGGQQDKKIEDLQKSVTELSGKLIALEATLIEKDKHIESLTKLIQGRNPEMMELLTTIKNSQKEEADYRKKMHEQNRKILDYQTKMLEKNEGRSEKIDQASIKHEGEPMRVPEELAQ